MYVVANTLNTLVLRTFCWCCIHFFVFTGALCAGSRVDDATPENTNMDLIWPIKRYRYRYGHCALFGTVTITIGIALSMLFWPYRTETFSVLMLLLLLLLSSHNNSSQTSRVRGHTKVLEP